MSDFTAALEKLRACRNSQDTKEVNAIFNELEILTVTEGWPKGFLEELTKLLGDELYLELKDSWTLVYFISSNWEELTDRQRDDLRVVLANAFDKYKDWMGAFVTSEIFGERYADENALETLTALGRKARLPARAAVPHGFEILARTTPHETSAP